MDRFETNEAYITRYANDILILKFKTDVLLQLEKAKEIDAVLMSMAQKKPNYFIVDALSIDSNMTSESLKYFSRQSKISKYTLATAILLDNLPIRLTASVFMRFHNPVFITKTFSTQEKALNWFFKLRKEN